MKDDKLRAGEAYLDAWSRRDLEGIAKFLHTEVRFIGPMSQTTGKEAFLRSAQRVFGLLKQIEVRSKFAGGDQALFTYDFICSEPIGVCRTAELMTFQNGLIRTIELFFDARPFKKMMQAQAQVS